MAVRVPFNPSVQVGEAQATTPGAVIRLRIGNGSQRTMTTDEARLLIELLRAGIERAESGEKLPAFPKPVRARERKAGE